MRYPIKIGKPACLLGLPKIYLAPQVRLELTTLRLTAECSAIELLRNIARRRIFRLSILLYLVKPSF